MYCSIESTPRQYDRVRLREGRFLRHADRGRWPDRLRPWQLCYIVGLGNLISIMGRTNLTLLTSSLIAIRHAPWCAIVSSAYDPLLPHNHTADAPLHAIASVSGQVRQLHKVLIPAWSQARLIG